MSQAAAIRNVIVFVAGALVMFAALEGYAWGASRRDVRRARKDRSR